MNNPSRTDDTLSHPGWNQNPPLLNADATTRQDLNGIANSRELREHAVKTDGIEDDSIRCRQINTGEEQPKAGFEVDPCEGGGKSRELGNHVVKTDKIEDDSIRCRDIKTKEEQPNAASEGYPCEEGSKLSKIQSFAGRSLHTLLRFTHFVGPGFLIAVAYIDPGNYATDVAAGAQSRYALLFVVFMSNLFAVFLQALCIKLGSVTGLNLAENCREHLPKWMVIILYIFAELAIIATDIAEVNPQGSPDI
jgi:metal iron transporter